MALEKLQELLGEELWKQVAPKLEGKEYFFAEGKDFIPISKFNEVNDAKKEAEKQLQERDKQLDALEKSAKGNEDLTKQINDLKEANTKAQEEYNSKVLEIQKSYELDKVLTSSGARNSSALKGMLDLSKCEFKEGKYIGLDEQIAQVKKDNEWLFTSSVPQSSGAEHGKSNPSADEFANLRNL